METNFDIRHDAGKNRKFAKFLDRVSPPQTLGFSIQTVLLDDESGVQNLRIDRHKVFMFSLFKKFDDLFNGYIKQKQTLKLTFHFF